MAADARTDEPSMEEILASIRRIISEEPADDQAPPKADRTQETSPRPEPLSASTISDPDFLEGDDPLPEDEAGDVLELTDELPEDEAMAEAPEESASFEDEVNFSPDEPIDDPAVAPILSDDVAKTASQSLNWLSDMVVRPKPGSENTLDGLVREMLRPMLKEWLDQNLPDMVEKMVAREIARISGRVK